jgi:hypothetical protein
VDAARHQTIDDLPTVPEPLAVEQFGETDGFRELTGVGLVWSTISLFRQFTESVRFTKL